jgi:hypothetical protein
MPVTDPNGRDDLLDLARKLDGRRLWLASVCVNERSAEVAEAQVQGRTMPSYKRTSHLLHPRIVLLAATMAIAAAMIGTAAVAAAASAPNVSSALQPGQTDSLVAPALGGGMVYGAALWAPAHGPSEALQPGQTYASVAPVSLGNAVGGPTSALQPGQTDSLVAGAVSQPVLGSVMWTPAPGPSVAPQPGQTGW